MYQRNNLTWFTSAYNQIAIIFPMVVTAPRFFAKEIQLGGLMRIASAFAQVQSALSFLVDSFYLIAEWNAVVQRLTGFSQGLADVDTAAQKSKVKREETDSEEIVLDQLTIALPGEKRLFENINLVFPPKKSVLITGPTGSCKSSLFKTIADIWPYGRGRIGFPQGKRLLFRSQKPYMPVGSLRSAMLFPGTSRPTTRRWTSFSANAACRSSSASSTATRTGSCFFPATSSSGSPSRAAC